MRYISVKVPVNKGMGMGMGMVMGMGIVMAMVMANVMMAMAAGRLLDVGVHRNFVLPFKFSPHGSEVRFTACGRQEVR